jgi:hypothetical protein
LLGWVQDGYIAPTRPFRSFRPYPRKGEFYGFSLSERLNPLQAEASTIRNQRNDAVDIAVAPPLIIDETLEQNNKTMQWGPAARWAGRGDITKMVHQVAVSPPPPQSYNEEVAVNGYADQVSGLSSPIEGASTSTRRSATEIKQRAGGTDVRSALVSMFYRYFSRSVINFVWDLKKQYPPTPGPGTLPAEAFKMDFSIDIAGIHDPLNPGENPQESLALLNIMLKVPDIAQNAMARYELEKYVFRSMHIPNIEAILGTEEDAQMRAKAEEEQRKMQAQMAQAAMAQGGKPGQPGANGAAPQPGGGVQSMPAIPPRQ